MGDEAGKNGDGALHRENLPEGWHPERHPNNPNLRAPWKKGESGNPAGRKPGPSLVTAIRNELSKDPERLKRIADTVLEMAEKKDMRAVLALLDRLDGGVNQQTTQDDEEHVPAPEFIHGPEPQHEDDAQTT